MTIFDVIEKQQKSQFCLQFFFLLKLSLQTQKSTFTAKFSPISSLQVFFFCSYSLLGSSSSLSFWCILTLLQFSTSQLHCMLGNSQNFQQRSFLPHIFHIYTKSTATPTYHRNFVLVVFFSGCKFQSMPC